MYTYMSICAHVLYIIYIWCMRICMMCECMMYVYIYIYIYIYIYEIEYIHDSVNGSCKCSLRVLEERFKISKY